MSKPHDLDQILLQVAKLGLPAVRPTIIEWVDLDEVEHGLFDEAADWACIVHEGEHSFIGLHPDLQRAPKYVVTYIVFHELLHEHIQSEGSNDHPPAFRVAERLCPRYQDAVDWLARYADCD